MHEVVSTGAPSARELNNSMTGVLLAHVRRVGGSDAVDAVLRRAGDVTSLTELEDPANWSSYEATLARFAAAAEILGDHSVGRHAGSELFSHYASSEVIALLRSLGSPTAAMGVIADTATKQSTVVTMECLEATDTGALVSAVTTPPRVRDRLFCDYTAGVLGAMPPVFGLAPAEVEELECQRRGDGRCLYRVTWDPDGGPAGPGGDAERLVAELSALTGRFEALEQLATDLASMADVEEALQAIIERAGVAVWAPRFLLVVRLPRDEAPRVHAIGFDAEEAARCGAELLSDAPDDHGGSRLVVDVSSSTQRFGRLAAFTQEGHRFLPEERRLLAAYAGHAAAVLATAAALAEARERAATIEALFALATRLSEVGTVDEVAERLACALPAVVDCEEACVFVWEPGDAVLRCRGRSEPTPVARTPGGWGTSIALDRSLLARLTRHPEPMVFGPHSADTTWREIGAAAGYHVGVVMPVVARHSLLGLVVAASERWAPEARRGEHWGERLHGVAGIAATALDNARLLDQVRHQAGHDSLTGLPNARRIEDLSVAALSNARRHGYGLAVLFVDLDLFKEVNDRLGHHAGDQLLVEVASRLRSAVRAGDTVARLGGDEFAVLLPHVVDSAEAEAVARRILDVLGEPLSGPWGQAEVSASIGIAVSPDATGTFETLLRWADGAMYVAKADGRATYRLAV
jgi:diguanylate cyclase (GGDEF)-like protein